MTPMEAAIPTNPPEAPPEPAEPGTGLGQRSQGVRGAEPATAATPEADERGDRDESGKYLSREAASYRRRLRDTEAERDGLRERLERYERAEVERIAGQSGLAVASDVWGFGAQLENLRTDDGIDSETVTGLVADIIKSRPGLQAQKAGNLGLGHGGTTPGAGARVGLSQLLRPDR